MTKKILTFEDLLEFCKQQNFTYFNSKDSGYQLAVQIPTIFKFEETSDDNHRGMLRLKFRIFHEGLNRNGSFVSKEAADDAASTIADRPILAHIHQLDDGTYDFHSHDYEVIENENGEKEIRYIETQVGSFTSEPTFWEYDEELDKNYLCAYGYISEEYTKAADIIREKDGTKNSCELAIEELAYNAKESYIDLKKFYVAGSTFLGSEKDGTPIGEGMLGSCADIADFSAESNSILSQNDELKTMLEMLNQKIDALTINKESKEGGKPLMNKFEELLSKYNIKAEDVTFEYENLSDEELEQKFEEIFGESDPEQEDGEGPVESENDSDPESDSETDSEPTSDPESVTETNSLKMSVNINGEVRTFQVSLIDKLNALYSLVNETYGEADNEYYDIDVMEDDKEVYMFGWFSGKNYKQKYSVKKDEFSLKGDRVEVYSTYLTADEQKQLEQMKANYSSIESELAKYKAEPEKLEILASEEYSSVSDTEEFKALSEQSAHFDLSIDEVKSKADAILLKAAKSGSLNFSQKEDKPNVGYKYFGITKKKNSRYGGLLK